MASPSSHHRHLAPTNTISPIAAAESAADLVHVAVGGGKAGAEVAAGLLAGLGAEVGGRLAAAAEVLVEVLGQRGQPVALVVH